MPALPPLKPYWTTPDREQCRLYLGNVTDVLKRLPSGSVQCVVTSPPYWALRDYKAGNGEIGQEASSQEFVEKMVEVFTQVRRVLRDDGCLWLNLGDTYGAGGDLVGIPWRVALALQTDGWVLRSDMPWVKRSAMPESVQNRPAKALEYVFLLTKRSGYYFDMEAVRRTGVCGPLPWERANGEGWDETKERGGKQQAGSTGARSFRNSDLWFDSVDGPHGMTGMGDELVGLDVTGRGYAGAHFATYPEWLVEPLIKAGTSEKGACSDCGAPWRRVVDRVASEARQGRGYTAGDGVLRNDGDRPGTNQGGRRDLIGWQPTCECHGRLIKQLRVVQRPVSLERTAGQPGGAYAPPGQAPHGNARDRSLPQNRNGITGSLDGVPRDVEEVEEEVWVYEPVISLAAHPVVPCRVLDPFVGSGTTCAVALRLGRRGWGIDLSEVYLREHAIKRVGQVLLELNGASELAAPEAEGVVL